MSVHVMNWVWRNSSHGGTGLLLMLATAGRCSEYGGGADLSIADLAERARVSTRTVKRELQILEESGELVIERNAGPNGENLYRVTFRRGTGKALPLYEDASEVVPADGTDEPRGVLDDTNAPARHGETGDQGSRG